MAILQAYHDALIASGFTKEGENRYRKDCKMCDVVLSIAGDMANAKEYPKSELPEFNGMAIDLFNLMPVRDVNDLNYLLQHISIRD